MKYFHPRRIARRIGKGLHDWFFFYLIPDEWEIRYRFKKILGYSCNLKNPETFNEKIQWLKLHDRNPLYPKLTDKLQVKEFVAGVIGEEHVIPTLAGGFSHFDEIPFDTLPDQFVLKCNHDSKSTIVCKDKQSFDFEYAKKKLEKALKRNYYHYNGKQWGYKNIIPKIFVEQFLSEADGKDLRDYKFFMFNGKCKTVFFFEDRFSASGVRCNPYDPRWQRLPFTWGHRPNTNYPVRKPDNLDEMLLLAKKLAEAIGNDFVRIDFYDIDNKVYFGEITFYPGGGYDAFIPGEWDGVLGSWLNLNTSCSNQ